MSIINRDNIHSIGELEGKIEKLKDEYEKSNDYSIIVGVEYGKYKFLFAADAEDERMKEFINEETGKYTFLKIGNPIRRMFSEDES